jgi:hypothetical protein
MPRGVLIAGVFVLAGSMVVSAQNGQRRGGGAGTTTPARGNGQAQNPELQQARETLQHDIAEGKRLQEQLKTDRSAGNRDAVQHDNEELKRNREKVKQDQERLKQLTAGRGGGRGRGSV